MSTRGHFSFFDQETDEVHHVYVHCDSYPSHAIPYAIAGALNLAWRLPRFEADDFAAAFVAWNKLPEGWADTCKQIQTLEKRNVGNTRKSSSVNTLVAPADHVAYRGGNVRLVGRGPDWKEFAQCDIEYRYEIGVQKRPASRGKSKKAGEFDIYVRAFAVNCQDWKQGWQGEHTDTLLFQGFLDEAINWASKPKKAEAAPVSDLGSMSPALATVAN